MTGEGFKEGKDSLSIHPSLHICNVEAASGTRSTGPRSLICRNDTLARDEKKGARMSNYGLDKVCVRP